MRKHGAPTSRSKTTLLFIASIILAVAFGELVLRLFFPLRNVGPSFSEYDSVYGRRLKKDFSCERITREFRMQFSTNSLGFRGPEPDFFPEGGILFLGDSFTQGYGVNDGSEFPELVRKSLADRFGSKLHPVVNAGIGYTGTGRFLKFLRNEGKRFNPKIVVLQIMSNDFDDNLLEGMFSLTPNDSLIEHPVPQQSLSQQVYTFAEAIPGIADSYVFSLIKQVYFSSTI